MAGAAVRHGSLNVFHPLNAGHPAIPAARERFNVTRIGRIIAQRVTQFLPSRADAVIELNDSADWPEGSADLLRRHHLAENSPAPATFEGGFLEPGDFRNSAQFAGAGIERESVRTVPNV